jgi:hypothetical protein
MRNIIIDNTLEKLPLPSSTLANVHKRLDKKEGDSILFSDSGDNLLGKGIFHCSYLDYLSMCYSHHIGIILTPDILYYTLLCELAEEVKNSPEKYRSIFTKNIDTEEKEQVIIINEDPVVIDIHILYSAVCNRLPDNFDTEFTEEFSTSTVQSKTAFMMSFLDCVSSYYDYGMMMCGIPHIRVLGSIDDYNKITTKIDSFKTIFPDLIPYFKRFKAIVTEIKDSDDPIFYKKIFSFRECGSGGDEEVCGWFSDLYRCHPQVRYIGNYSPHISSVPYTNMDTKKKYEMCIGVVRSEMDEKDHMLIPSFSKYYMI